LASKAKDVMFSVFGEEALPPINTHATPSEIVEWKKKEGVVACYNKLFLPINQNSETLVLTRILEKVFPNKEKKLPLIQMAYVIAVCTTMLNQKYEKIKLDKVIMKKKVAVYYVSFCNFVN
jgi:hypothetical protein